ncbi:hypothetical protein BJX61DRAFT_123296 [Aspergillus egyptiacus]|nr:hypothetical protein BJX61DRAFT_123296 [Aspergillus egyptiacus]
MAQSTDAIPKRPKGILKNSSSQSQLHVTQHSPTPPAVDTKEITLQNTLQNAGRRPSTASRRTSLASSHGRLDEASPRLKWDEANLYLTEQEKTAKMKIDEPKTPYAPHYDPTEDEEEMRLAGAQESLINPQGVVVDEFDKNKPRSQKKISDDEIPELELGEPEESITEVAHGEGDRIMRARSLSNESHRSDKHVVVGTNGTTEDGDALLTPEEAKEKHRQFEQMRKKHYEMRNIKEILAHPEELDEMDEDDDEEASSSGAPPPVPQIPQQFVNRGK